VRPKGSVLGLAKHKQPVFIIGNSAAEGNTQDLLIAWNILIFNLELKRSDNFGRR
jgi:hypothetical protein